MTADGSNLQRLYIAPLIEQVQMCYLVKGAFQIHALILVQIRRSHEERKPELSDSLVTSTE